jgi:hypothetical protein
MDGSRAAATLRMTSSRGMMIEVMIGDEMMPLDRTPLMSAKADCVPL